MRTCRFLLCLVAMQYASVAFADDASYSSAMEKFTSTPDIAARLSEAYGYALLPTIAKGAVGIGGAYGEGRVYRGGVHVGHTSMFQASFGFQLGGQAYSQLILFKNKDAYDEFTTGKFAFSADATAVAITAGGQAKATTMGSSASASDSAPGGAATGEWGGGMLIFVYTKGGLMYEAALAGQRFNYRPKEAATASSSAETTSEEGE